MGNIYKISRLRKNVDGDGVVTLVGLWGCMLSCRYCQNQPCHDKKYCTSMTADEVAQIVLKDTLYYLATGGGVVFGGGEPLMQPEFVHEIISLIRHENICTRIETSLCSKWENIETLIDDIGEWIIDIKAVDKDIFTSYTGNIAHITMQNLERLSERVNHDKILVRIPIIPGYKDLSQARQEALYIEQSIGVRTELFEYKKDAAIR